MSQIKKSDKKDSEKLSTQKKTTRKTAAITRRRPQTQTELDQAFNQAIDRFRSDFEDLLFPFEDIFVLPEFPEVRTPVVDLQDREKDFLLRAEMPGFKKDDVEISVQDDGVEISAVSGWKYDQDEETYICKERACKSFYRYVDLPEEIKIEDTTANLSEGILEIALPKKTLKPQKQKRKVQVK